LTLNSLLELKIIESKDQLLGKFANLIFEFFVENYVFLLFTLATQ